MKLELNERTLAVLIPGIYLIGVGLGLGISYSANDCSSAPTSDAQWAMDDWFLPVDSVTKDLRALTLVVGGRLAYRVIVKAGEQGLDPKLVGAVIWVESHGNPNAVSVAGAIGLMQVMPDIWLGVYPECGDDLFDPDTNLCYGTRILRYHIEQADGDTLQGLRDYSGGARRYVHKVNYRRRLL